MSKYARIKYKIFRINFCKLNVNTFLCNIMRGVILYKKKLYTILFKKNSDDFHITLKKLIFLKINTIMCPPSDNTTFV